MINEMALNEAGWAFIDAWRVHTDQTMTGNTFNHTKAMLRTAIEMYLEMVKDPPMDKEDQEKLWSLIANIDQTLLRSKASTEERLDNLKTLLLERTEKKPFDLGAIDTGLMAKLVKEVEEVMGRHTMVSAPETVHAHLRTIGELQSLAHNMACEKGWWDDPRGIPECLALIHSEASEALEDYRNGNMGLLFHRSGDDFLTPEPKNLMEYAYAGYKPEGFSTELADIVIRVMDLAGYLKIDLQEAIEAKMAYNSTRPHRHGGKRA